jgi:CRP-like cAMP-binding protein
VQCAESGTYLRIDYANIEQLVIQNPEFGLYLMRLASSRLFENIATLEEKLANRNIS